MRRFAVFLFLSFVLTSTSAFADASAIVPHRAIYKMSLASVKNGSQIADVSGKMYFDWGDACDGWAVQQRLMLHFAYAEGEDADLSSAVVTWESKDGQRYNFNVRRVTDGKTTESYRGRATLSAQGGVGRYTLPKRKKDIALPEGSLFPSAHTVLILDRAHAGDHLFTRRIFDGSDEAGAADISAFIGEKQTHLTAGDKTEGLQGNPLLQDSAWPVRLAFFKPDSETGAPDYEMDLVLQDNGIARSMHMDYGDFAVDGVLETLETSPTATCADAQDEGVAP
jgi:hypothetical protein